MLGSGLGELSMWEQGDVLEVIQSVRFHDVARYNVRL